MISTEKNLERKKFWSENYVSLVRKRYQSGSIIDWINGLIVCFESLSSRGCDTVLGEASDPHELFLVDDCEDTRMEFIKEKIQVRHFRKKRKYSSRRLIKPRLMKPIAL